MGSGGDHRIAMLGAVAGLVSREGVDIEGAEAVSVCFPDSSTFSSQSPRDECLHSAPVRTNSFRYAHARAPARSGFRAFAEGEST